LSSYPEDVRNQSFLETVPLHRVYSIIALLLGSLFLFTTPPFQVSDESGHFFRAYQISEGIWKTEVSPKALTGAYVPVSIVELWKNPTIQNLVFREEARMTPAYTLSLLHVPLNPQVRTLAPETIPFYPPHLYIPQAIGIGLGRLLNLPPIVLLYLGRFCNLLGWIVLVSLALYLAPFFRWIFFLLALMPIQVFNSASLSADNSVIGYTFVLIALLMRAAFESRERLGRGMLCAIFVAVILQAPAKIVYTPILFLFLLIPTNRFRSVRRYYFCFSCLLGAACAASAAWSGWSGVTQVIPVYQATVFGIQGIDIAGQKAYICSHPLQYAVNVLRTYYYNDSLSVWMGRIGWSNRPLPENLILFYSLLFPIAICQERSSPIEFTRRQRMVVFMSLLTSVALLTVVLYLTCCPVGSPRVRPIVLGRYFVPLAPLFFLLFHKIRFSKVGVMVSGAIALGLWCLYVSVRNYYG